MCHYKSAYHLMLNYTETVPKVTKRKVIQIINVIRKNSNAALGDVEGLIS